MPVENRCRKSVRSCLVRSYFKMGDIFLISFHLCSPPTADSLLHGLTPRSPTKVAEVNMKHRSLHTHYQD